MTENRIAFTTNEGFYDADKGGYALALVEEGVAGWSPLSYWDTLAKAENRAIEGNATQGNTAEDVLAIVRSSMQASSKAQAERETIKVTFELRVPDETLDTIIEMAGYGITYWAEEATEDEKATFSEDVVMVFAEVEGGPRTVRGITYDDLRKAISTTFNDPASVGFSKTAQHYMVNAYRSPDADGGLDAGEIDALAADELVQVATLGSVIYG